MSRPALEM